MDLDFEEVSRRRTPGRGVVREGGDRAKGEGKGGSPTEFGLDINMRERGRMIGAGLASIMVAAPVDLQRELGHEVTRVFLTRLRSQARRLMLTGIALRECVVRAGGEAGEGAGGPASGHRQLVQTIVAEHVTRLESIAAAACSVNASMGGVPTGESALLQRAPELQQLGTWILTLGEQSENDEEAWTPEAASASHQEGAEGPDQASSNSVVKERTSTGDETSLMMTAMGDGRRPGQTPG